MTPSSSATPAIVGCSSNFAIEEDSTKVDCLGNFDGHCRSSLSRSLLYYSAWREDFLCGTADSPG